MECFGGEMNKMVCGMGWDRVDWVEKGDGGGDVKLGLGLVGLSLGLGDCVWCVLLPKPVANATFSSKSTPPVSHN